MSYVDEVLAKLKEKNASEPEFLQAAEEVLDSLRPVIDANEELYKKATKEAQKYFENNFAPKIALKELIETLKEK